MVPSQPADYQPVRTFTFYFSLYPGLFPLGSSVCERLARHSFPPILRYRLLLHSTIRDSQDDKASVSLVGIQKGAQVGQTRRAGLCYPVLG